MSAHSLSKRVNKCSIPSGDCFVPLLPNVPDCESWFKASKAELMHSDGYSNMDNTTAIVSLN